MARATSWSAPLSVVVFFLAGAAGAILWDLRGHAPRPERTAAGSAVSAGKAPARGSAPLPGRPPKRLEKERPDPGRAPARARRIDPRFEKVGIPMAARPAASQPHSSALSEEQAQRILRSLIESRGYYGLSSDCLWARPLGYRDASYGFEIVAADCASIVRGSVIGRWNVDANTGEASYRTPEGTYRLAP